MSHKGKHTGAAATNIEGEEGERVRERESADLQTSKNLNYCNSTTDAGECEHVSLTKTHIHTGFPSSEEMHKT